MRPIGILGELRATEASPVPQTLPLRRNRYYRGSSDVTGPQSHIHTLPIASYFFTSRILALVGEVALGNREKEPQSRAHEKHLLTFVALDQ